MMKLELGLALVVVVVRAAAAAPAPALDANTALSLADFATAADRPEQEQILVALIADTPDSDADEKSDYLFRLGRFYAARYHADPTKKAEMLKAVKVFKALSENDAFRNYPKMDVALFDYGLTLQTGKYMKEARTVYDKLLKNYPNSKYVPEAHLAFGEYYFDNNQLADAEARYKMVLKFPKSHTYWYAMYKMGWVHFQLQRYQEALETFFEVVQATKTDPTQDRLHREAETDFVRAYAEVGKPDKASAAFRRVDGAAMPHMLEVYADLERERGKADEAVFIYRELAKQSPASPDACRWQTKIIEARQGTAAEANETQHLASMRQCTDALPPEQQRAIADATLRSTPLPADPVIAAPPKQLPVADPIPPDEQATLARLEKIGDAPAADDRARAKIARAAIYRNHGHHDEAMAILADVVKRERDSNAAELAADLWLDSLVRLHRFDVALEVVDRLVADKPFLAGKPTLQRNVDFLRSHSLR
jgi:tetratricopeptide (TPR) repeat protein